MMGVDAGFGVCQKNHATLAKSIVMESRDTVFIAVEVNTAKPYTVL